MNSLETEEGNSVLKLSGECKNFRRFRRGVARRRRRKYWQKNGFFAQKKISEAL
jgi:hypothetical protein